MKKSASFYLKTWALAAAILAANIAANAQKLPGVQQTSLRAPDNVKIDGKIADWGSQLQAYNHATDIYYTIANDDDNLYLTIHATDATIIRKIMGSGIDFVIQRSGKKNEKDAISIVYPMFDMGKRPAVRLKRRGDAVPTDQEAAARQADSIMLDNNKRFSQYAKWINVNGIKGVDSLISVYNEDGIKAAGAFDNQQNFSCEIRISLKQLGLTVADAIKFTYHITLGKTPPVMKGMLLTRDGAAGGGGAPKVMTISGGSLGAGAAGGGGGMVVMVDALDGPTDFWGEYTLVKK